MYNITKFACTHFPAEQQLSLLRNTFIFLQSEYCTDLRYYNVTSTVYLPAPAMCL